MIEKKLRQVNFLILSLCIVACTINNYPDLSRFESSARHWYKIFDEVRIIQPLEGNPQYKESQYTKIADNILLFQKNNGGWAKNYDMKAIITEEQIQILLDNKDELNTNFDNGTTHSQLTYLAEVYALSKNVKYKDSFLKGMRYTLDAQYENGGWPQFYPDTSGYRKHITFNDMAMVGIMELLQDIIRNVPIYNFMDDSLRTEVTKSYKKGLDCILKCQIIDNKEKTVWCQQHDHVNFEPRDARSFEKASICNKESAEIIRLLMNIQNPDKEIIDTIESAVKWFSKAEIHGIRIEWIESTEEQFIHHKTKYDRIVVKDPTAPRIWPRFNQLSTHKPIFVSRSGDVFYSMAEIDRDRRTGYGWYTDEPESVLSIYPEWHKKWNNDQ